VIYFLVFFFFFFFFFFSFTYLSGNDDEHALETFWKDILEFKLIYCKTNKIWSKDDAYTSGCRA